MNRYVKKVFLLLFIPTIITVTFLCFSNTIVSYRTKLLINKTVEVSDFSGAFVSYPTKLPIRETVNVSDFSGALLVDETVDLSESFQYEQADKHLPSFPLEFWRNASKSRLQVNKTCAHYPSPFDVQFQNVYWQNLRSNYGHYQLFGAYLDDRAANPLGPTVRVLAMADQVEPIRMMYCQMWFIGKTQPVIVEAGKYDLIWNKAWGNYKKGAYQPYLIPCPIAPDYHALTVAAVSLVENICDHATNVLKVFNNKPSPGETRHDFAVCVKGVDFLLEDISSVLTEWIEMVKLLGAHKIFMYNLQVHPNVSKVFTHYENQGFLEVTPLTLPAEQPNSPYLQHIYLKKKVTQKRQGELIPYNDCFYKHMYQYKYILLVDVDEVIVPLNHATWNELFVELESEYDNKYDSYRIRNVYFFTDLLLTHKWFDDIPDYMHILNHVNRAPEILKPGVNVKSFFQTERILSLHNHSPIGCLQGSCKSFSVSPEQALMHHYKRKPKKRYNTFRETSIIDTTIWKYKKTLIENVTKSLTEMGFLVQLKT